MASPYEGVPPEQWPEVTRSLVEAHPADPQEIVDIVLLCWKGIFQTAIAGRLKIGEDIFPGPSILSSFIHELVPAEFEQRYPGTWRREQSAAEKDLVYLPDDRYSVEIKASSQKGIYGNRSFTQVSVARPQKKDKSGYYLAINFPPVHKTRDYAPISMVRFGWLDIGDWRGQVAASGQQASLPRDVLEGKLLLLYP